MSRRTGERAPIIRGELAAMGEAAEVLANMGHRRPLDARTLAAIRGPAIGVAGMGRCGTTMVMDMLRAGGVPTMGVWPYEDVQSWQLAGMDLHGYAVKLVQGGAMAEIPVGRTPWTFVWMDRDPTEQARSQRKFLTANLASVTKVPPASDPYVQATRHNQEQSRPSLLGGFRQVGPVLVLEFERVLRDPRRAARQLRDEVFPRLDVDRAASVVVRRDPACAPDIETWALRPS